MNGNINFRSSHINKQSINELKQFFQNNPVSQFNLKTLSGCFPGCDIYNCLLELENETIVIRSKININDKPVTHWQLKKISVMPPMAYNTFYQSEPRNFNPTESYRINSSTCNTEDHSQYLKLNIKVKSTDCGHLQSPNNNSQLSPSMENPSGKKIGPPPRRLIAIKDPNQRLTETVDMSLLSLHTDEETTDQKQKCEEIKSPEQGRQGLEKEETFENNDISAGFLAAVKQNPVSILYEFAQQKGLNCQIDVLEMVGPSHKPKISMVASINGRKFSPVNASNKKEGKRLAAETAIRKLISEGFFSGNISKLLTQAAIKKNTNKNDELMEVKTSAPILTKMASLVFHELNNLIRDTPIEKRKILSGRKVVAGIIMQDEKHDKLQVVALATGNRCISGDKISLQGRVINDCHAEVVARRSFMLFLYQQLFAHLTSSDESLDIFEDYQESSSLSVLRRFKLKVNIKFHLYISTAPCGDGALFCSKEHSLKLTESELISSKRHRPTIEHPVQGLLRSKIEGGEGTIPVMNVKNIFQVQSLDGILRGERLKTMSCSDKIARWNYLGLQGALLTQFLEPIFLASVSLGNMYDPGHLSRAICCRLARDISSTTTKCIEVNHPDIGYAHVEDLCRDTDKTNEFSINWSHGLALEIIDGVTGQLTGPEKRMVCSRLAKASLFHQYLKLFKTAGFNPYVNRYSYKEAKLLSQYYEQKKEQLFEIFHNLEYGSWIRKPSEQSEFKDSFYN